MGIDKSNCSMEKKTKEELRHDLIRQMSAFQNGIMTYYRLFTTLERNDRFHFGEVLSELCDVICGALATDYPDQSEKMNAVAESLCELDACDPHKIPGDCEYHDTFLSIFDAIGEIKAGADIDYSEL